MQLRSVAAALACSSLAAPATAESTSDSFQTRSTAATSGGVEQFAPAASSTEHRIDYAHWDEALGWFVIPMGPSLREGAPRVEPFTGSRRVYGHDSRYRLEGNRVAFSFFDDDVRASLTDYRMDLERIGTELDITGLPRNEQLAYWLNLHNVAMIEALAGAYPLSEPRSRRFGSNSASLDDAKLVSVNGVALSPRDIREGIVFPNWRDPKVIYGFWRGEIGGPSIQRLAYSGQNVDALLALSAEEFVNSLRGVEKFSGALQVSKIYEEAAPYYFADFNQLRGHLSQFAGDEVRSLIERTNETRYNTYETDLADLTRGEKAPGFFNFGTATDPTGGDRLFRSYTPRSALNPNSPISMSIQRLITERQNKLTKATKRGIRTGMVIYGDGEFAGEQKEVE
ncbi:DUF547 domain-containing protein [Erythrobacter crassostreae]|uniref:DUF547 domain-containing protein n=1 Tax=Erythrobacter crassostreae TaxID=2828328 RepID=A0A9X1F0Q0_9SPHN|nr:DUF547 domain-containing protein [Erythrobacter crassostrea]MBV7257984.1 DUF547 domain-containing protein [Erythrobacter crassostrea]